MSDIVPKNKKTYKCDTCGRNYSKKFNLKRHISNKSCKMEDIMKYKPLFRPISQHQNEPEQEPSQDSESSEQSDNESVDEEEHNSLLEMQRIEEEKRILQEQAEQERLLEKQRIEEEQKEIEKIAEIARHEQEEKERLLEMQRIEEEKLLKLELNEINNEDMIRLEREHLWSYKEREYERIQRRGPYRRSQMLDFTPILNKCHTLRNKITNDDKKQTINSNKNTNRRKTTKNIKLISDERVMMEVDSEIEEQDRVYRNILAYQEKERERQERKEREEREREKQEEEERERKRSEMYEKNYKYNFMNNYIRECGYDGGYAGY